MNEESMMKCEFPASIEIEIFDIPENAEPSIKSTSRRIMIDLRVEPENAFDSMRRSCESSSNKIDESDLQFKKHDEQRISMLRGIVIDSTVEPENVFDSMSCSCESVSNEIDESDVQFEKHDEQRTSTFRRIVTDLRVEPTNAFDSMCCSCESFSNEIDESDLQFKKHDEQRNSAFRGIVINVMDWQSKESAPMQAIRRLAAREGKKAEDGTMTSSPDTNPTTVADSAAIQTLTPATTTEALNILITIN
jgi:hypothetical protein